MDVVGEALASVRPRCVTVTVCGGGRSGWQQPGPCTVQVCMRAAHCPAELMAPFAASWAAACTRLHAAPTSRSSPHTLPRARIYKYRTRAYWSSNASAHNSRQWSADAAPPLRDMHTQQRAADSCAARSTSEVAVAHARRDTPTARALHGSSPRGSAKGRNAGRHTLRA